MDKPDPVKYGIEIEAETVISRLIPTIAILETLRNRNPEVYKIATEAIEKAYPNE